MIRSLDLPPLVAEIFEGICKYPDLQEDCQSPYYSFSRGVALRDSLIPLWESGLRITAYDTETKTYCKFCLESPDETYFEEVSFRGVVSFLIRDLWESDLPVDRIERIAEMFQYDQLSKLLSVLEEGRGEYSLWKAELFS